MINPIVSREKPERKINRKTLNNGSAGSMRVEETEDGYVWRLARPDGRGRRGEPQPTAIEAWLAGWPVATLLGALILADDHTAELVAINQEIEKIRRGAR